MREDHLVNQPTQFRVLGRHVRDDGLSRGISTVKGMKGANTNIDLAFLYENKYPVFPPFDILSTDFGTKMCGLREFAYGVFES